MNWYSPLLLRFLRATLASAKLGRISTRLAGQAVRRPDRPRAPGNRLTPTGNIAITNAFVVDRATRPLTAINIGEFVSIQADFTTQDLPGNASYVVGYTVNGLTQDSGTSPGRRQLGDELVRLLLGRLHRHTRDEPGQGRPSIRANPWRRRVTPTTP